MSLPTDKFTVPVGEIHFPAIYTPRSGPSGRPRFEVSFLATALPLEDGIHGLRAVHVSKRGLVRASSTFAPLVEASDGLSKLAAVLAEAEASNLGKDRIFTRCRAVLCLSVFEYAGRNAFGSYSGFGLGLHGVAVTTTDLRDNMTRLFTEAWT